VAFLYQRRFMTLQTKTAASRLHASGRYGCPRSMMCVLHVPPKKTRSHASMQQYSRTLLTAALCAALAVAAAAHEQRQPHHHQHHHFVAEQHRKVPTDATAVFASIHIDGDCSAALAETHAVDGAPSDFVHLPPGQTPRDLDAIPFDPASYGMTALSAPHAAMKWLITFAHPARPGERLGQVFLDPRLRVAEGRFGAPPSDAGAHESPDDAAGRKPDPMQHHLVDHDVHFVRFPKGVEEFQLHCRDKSAAPVTMSLRATKRRHHHVLAGTPAATAGGAAPIKLFNLQSSGPVTTQVNVIFLAAGFTAAEEDKFNATVKNIRDNMDVELNPSTGMANMHHSVPFDRYWKFYNVFALFQASAESGASRPKLGLTKQNNLGCFHPATIERAVTCKVDLTLAMADVSPANVKGRPDMSVIVVVVNTDMYGGSALFRLGQLHVGHFYTGVDTNGKYDPLKFGSLVNHEIGHAYGNLFDEYDIGISEPTKFNLLNCQAPEGGGAPTGAALKWKYWADNMAVAATAARYRGGIIDGTDPNTGARKWGVLQTPLKICGFSNYYKPNTYCMMQSVRDYYLCPVCREQSTKQVMSMTNFSLQWPRYPTPDAVLVVQKDAKAGYQTYATGVVLHMPTSLTVKNEFTVTWRDADGAVIPEDATVAKTCPQCRVLTAANFDKYPLNEIVRLTVELHDNTTFISDQLRATGALHSLVQSTTFALRVVQNAGAVGGVTAAPVATAAPATTAAPVNGSSRAFAALNTTVAPTTAAPAGALLNVSSYDAVFTTKGDYGSWPTLDVLATIQQCLSTPTVPDPVCRPTYTAKSYEKPEDFAGFIAGFDSWVLYMLAGIALGFVLAWVAAWSYYRGKSSQVVRPIFRTEFTGVVSVIRRIMIFAAVSFMFSSIAALIISGYFYVESSALGKIVITLGIALSVGLYLLAFVGFWAVSYRSKKLVLVNGAFLYTAFTVVVACLALGMHVGSQISDKKSYWNHNLDIFWQNLVEFNPERACALQGMLSCSGFYLPCDRYGSTLYCPINCEKTNELFATSCQKKLADYIANSYTTALSIVLGSAIMLFFGLCFNFTYYIKLAQMKKSIIDATNKRLHRHAAKANHSMKQVDKSKALFILKTLDDGDLGHLTKEFNRIDVDGNGQLDRAEFVMFFKKALCYKPSKEEIEEIYNVADLDGDGNISMDEFLALFGKSLPSRKPSSSNFTRLQDDQRKDEIRRRAAKQYGNDVVGGGGAHEMAHVQKQPASPRAAVPSRGAGQGLSTTGPARPNLPRQEAAYVPREDLL
jgi:hypothetical protein